MASACHDRTRGTLILTGTGQSARGKLLPARTYLVRDELPDRLPRHVDQVYPYTLKGLVNAMEDGRIRSYGDNPQLLIARDGEESRVVRRFERGAETEVPG